MAGPARPTLGPLKPGMIHETATDDPDETEDHPQKPVGRKDRH